MDGVIWFFLALLVALTISGVVVGLRRRRSGVDPMSRQCSNCRTPMSPRRVIFFVGRAVRASMPSPGAASQRRDSDSPPGFRAQPLFNPLPLPVAKRTQRVGGCGSVLIVGRG